MQFNYLCVYSKAIYAVFHITAIKMSLMGRVCITNCRRVLQNFDTAQPLFANFFSLAEKNLVAPIATARVAGFADLDLDQFGQMRLQSLPDPMTQGFAGGVLETRHLI